MGPLGFEGIARASHEAIRRDCIPPHFGLGINQSLWTVAIQALVRESRPDVTELLDIGITPERAEISKILQKLKDAVMQYYIFGEKKVYRKTLLKLKS